MESTRLDGTIVGRFVYWMAEGRGAGEITTQLCRYVYITATQQANFKNCMRSQFVLRIQC